MQYVSDEQLNDMFGLLDFDMLQKMGYDLTYDNADELDDLLMAIEEDFSELDREEKIAELRSIGAFEDDYLVSEVKMSAESANRALLAGSVDGEPAMFYHEKGVTDQTGFTPGLILTGDESEIVAEASRIVGSVSEKRQKQGFKNYKRNVWSLKRAETMGPAGGYLGGFSGSHDGVDYKVSFNCSHDLNSRDSYYKSEMRNYVEAQISNGYDSGSEPFVLTDERSGKQMKGTVTWESIETLDAETTDSDFPTVGKMGGKWSEGSPKVYTFYGIRTDLKSGKKYPYSAVGFGDKLEAWNHPNWGAKRLQGYNKEDPEEGTIDCGPDDDPDEFIELFFDLTEENKKDIRAIGNYVTDPRTNESYWTYKDAETKRQRMKREKEEAAMDEASTDVDYMREHYSESDAYIYAYNDGHSDGRSNTVSYRPSASDRELNSFKKIFKQAEHFAADSPFNTLLMIREDIIIDDEQDFDRLLSVYMSLESDIAQLYQETDNPKHPLLGEMMRYRNRIANRLDELQEEVAIQDTIEMDAEQRRLADPTVPIQLEKPLRTGYKLGIGAIAAGLTIPLAILGIGAFYNRE